MRLFNAEVQITELIKINIETKFQKFVFEQRFD